MSTNKKPAPAMAKQSKKSDTPAGGGGGKDLKMMPTATLEQIQIAKIIDTHRQEDPDLQIKIRQVMDITRTTEDEACKALHSREYDIDEAITLLVEGKSSEWEEAKRRKGKQQGGKKQGGVTMERSSDPTPHAKESPSDINQRGGYARGSSRGRGSARGNYRQADNKENDEQRTGRYVPRGVQRGGRDPGRGRGGGRDATSRTFASKKVTSSGADFNHPIDVWENSQAEKTGGQSSGGGGGEAMKVEKWDEFPSAEDWDNEEYTGSLAESKVFTPSTQQQQQTNTTAVSSTPSTPATTTDSRANGIMSLFDTKKAYGNGDTTEQQQRILHNQVQVVAGQSIDLSLLLQKPVIEQSYSNVTNQQQQGEQQQQRNKQRVAPGATVRQQQIPKIPPSGVEMPDDSSLSQLDVQFGGMEFGSSAFNTVQSHQESQQPKPSSPFQNRQMTDVASNELNKSQQQSQHNQYQQGSAFVSYAAKGGAPGFPAPVVTSSVVVTQQQQPQQGQGQQSQAPTYTNISQQHYQQPYNNYQPSSASVSTTPYGVIPQLSYNQMSNQQQPGYYSQYNSYSQKYTQQQQNIVKDEATSSPVASTTTTQPITTKLTTTGPTLTTASTKATIPPIAPTQSLPPGMMLHPQYIVNQSGLPLYGFQAPLYGYDENSTTVQFLPRLPHPGLTSYYDTSYAPPPPNPPQASRPDPYPPSDRYQRPSDTSTASPIPSTQQQQIYNPAVPQYYYVGNNMIHPGAFPYGPPPTMYQSSPAAAATPGVASAGTAGSAGGVPSANQQSQYTTTATNKYMGNYYDQQQSGVEYKYKQSDLGNYKGQQHKINSYEKPYTPSGMYGNPLPAGQTQLNPTGMGYGVYLPSDNQQQQQRQSNPKQNTGGKQQFGNQPYWTGGN